MTRKPIAEEDGVHKEWYERARKQTLATLPEFLRELTEDYEHDYGTIVHAITAASVATAWAINASDQGGITGFQAGFIGWGFLQHWGSPDIGECGARILKYEDLLYPQYEDKFTHISAETWAGVQKAAAARIAEKDCPPHPAVLAHWQSIVDGKVPFGLTVIEEEPAPEPPRAA